MEFSLIEIFSRFKQVFNPIKPLQQSKKRLSLIESGRNDRKELLFKRNDL